MNPESDWNFPTPEIRLKLNRNICDMFDNDTKRVLTLDSWLLLENRHSCFPELAKLLNSMALAPNWRSQIKMRVVGISVDFSASEMEGGMNASQ